MNLAQLIDPERAREGFGKSSLDKPASQPARGTVNHKIHDSSPTPAGGLRRATGRIPVLRAAMARPGGPWTTKQLYDALGDEPHFESLDRLSGAVCQLVRQREALASSGRPKTYALTARGLAKVPPPETP